MPDFIEKLYIALTNKDITKQYIKSIIKNLYDFLDFINKFKFDNKIKEFTIDYINQITVSDLYCYMAFLSNTNFKNNTRITKLKNLRIGFKYLYYLYGCKLYNDYKDITLEHINLKSDNYISKEQSIKLLNVYNDNNFINIRNNAIMHLMLSCGLRSCELLRLDIDDIFWENKSFKISGKNKTERTGYIDYKTDVVLSEYWQLREKKNISTNALFINNHNERLKYASLRKIIKHAYKCCNIDEKIYANHTLRHTCATNMYENGVDIKIIKELLGHITIDSTQKYVHIDKHRLKKIIARHPLANFNVEDEEI